MLNLEQMKLPIKDIIKYVVFIFLLSGAYFTIQDDIKHLKEDNEVLSNRMDAHRDRISTYSDLPNRVKNVEKVLENIEDKLNVIHDGLVAKGIIAPRVNR